MKVFFSDSPVSKIFVLSVLCLVALLLFWSTPTDGDFWWYDASRHAMNGVFIRDFILQGGIFQPIDFAKAYYTQYPAVNIGIYPPFLYLTSAPFLAMFGVSHAVSQLVISLYGLAAGIFTYLICARHMDRFAATTTSVLVMTFPGMALWGRQVQPDVPAAALVIGTLYFLIKYFESGKKLSLYTAAVCMGCAVLTRTQMVFAIPLFALFVLFHPAGKQLALRFRIAALAITATLAAPAVLMLLYFAGVFSRIAVSAPNAISIWSINNWAWYASRFFDLLGWPGFLFLIAGMLAGVSSLRRFDKHELALVGGTAISCWLFFTLVSSKEQRYVIICVALLLILAAVGMYLANPKVARMLLALAAGSSTYHAIAVMEVPIFGGFKEAVDVAVKYTPKDTNILISAQRDGSFVYDVRALGTRPDIGVRRGDKLFVEMRISRLLGIQDRNLDEKAILKILSDEKISTIVAQNNYLDDQPTIRIFQTMLDSGNHFVVVKRIPLRGDTSRFERELVVYRRATPVSVQR